MSVAVEGRSTLRQSLFEQNERFQKLVDLIPTSLYTHKPVYLQQKQKWTKHNGDDRSKKQKPKQKEARKDKSKVAPAENVRMDMDDNLPVHKVQTNGSSANLSRQEIRDKLHAKIASFASERNAPAPAQITASSAPSPAPSTSTGGKQALIAQAQAEKKARLEDSKKRKKEERKQRQKALQKALKEAEGDERPSEDSKGKGKARMDVDIDQEAASDAWVDVTADSSLVVARPNRSDGVDMPVDAVDFSHLDFTDQATVKPVDLLPGHSRKTKSKVSQEQAALDRIEQRKKFLDKIGQQSRERAEEKDRWQKAETRIEGGKVLDEEKRLRKMAKRKEKAKEDSRREWANREKAQSDQQAAKQKQRNANIKARAQAKKDKKNGVKPSKKKGSEKKKQLSHASKKATGRKVANERGFELSLKAKKAKMAATGKSKGGKN